VSGESGDGGGGRRDVAATEAIRVRVPFRRQVVTSAGTWSHRESWILRLFDAGGAVGLGEAALDFGTDEAEAELARLVRETVELARGGRLPPAAGVEAAGVAGRALRCALDSAMLDLQLRSAPRAGGPQSVPVNATIGFLGLSEVETAAREAVGAGFGTIKMKVGPERDAGELVERVATVRSAVGPAVRLRLDANGAWDVATAGARIKVIAPYDIEYVEQPVAAGSAHELATIRKAAPVRIGADESVCCLEAARELIEAEAADVLVVKPARVGGPTAAREIAVVAAAVGVPVVLSTLFETGVGIAAALFSASVVPGDHAPGEHAHGLATADLLESDLLAMSLRIVRGRMIVPDGPGLGIALDEEALRHYAVETVRGRL
jgi:o-succinylbenzoate synthase